MKQDAYTRLIDAMVVVAQRCVSAGRILKYGHPVRPDEPDSALADEEKKLKAVFARLDEHDRRVLARALLTERQSGLHDFAAFLQEAMSKGKMAIKWDGQTLGLNPSSTMQADFIKHLSDWEKR
jgi:hypothetical protein